MGFKLFENPHRKNKDVTNIKAKPVLVAVLVDVFCGSAVFILTQIFRIIIYAQRINVCKITSGRVSNYKVQSKCAHHSAI